jgi:hypothetical protein
MNVQELIDELMKIEDKTRRVLSLDSPYSNMANVDEVSIEPEGFVLLSENL